MSRSEKESDPRPQTSYAVCNFCDGICGLEISHDGREVLSIKGDPEDPFSKGHICPKGLAHGELHDDPDRLTHPIRRKGNRWEEVGWDEAIAEVGRRLTDIQRRHGNDSIAFYYGDPVAHNYSTQLFLLPFIKTLRTKNIYSANSVDSLPRMLASLLLYGNQAAIPVPDLDRTNYLLILGANPAVSNGSSMTAPGCIRRLKEIRERGGKVVLLDPRRTETARLADEHFFIRPGTDALFLLSLLHTLFQENRIAPGHLRSRVSGLEEIREIVRPFSPKAVAGTVGIGASSIRRIAIDFAELGPSVCYGRMGTCTQEFGGFSTFLEDVVNVVTGNLDRPGGSMFTTPAVDLTRIATVLRETGHFNQWRSRVSGLPEFNGELPVAALAEEMETPGPGQIKALVVLAGNPGISLPNSHRLERAMRNLELMVCIDIYKNETTRLADIILPPASHLEQEHYHIIFHSLAVRNTAHYAPAVFPKPAGAKHDWEILLELAARLHKNRGVSAALVDAGRFLAHRLTPERQLDLMLRIGPRRMSLERLKRAPHGIDFGPLEPRLDEVVCTKDRKVNLSPCVFLRDVARLRKKVEQAPRPDSDELLLVGRRGLRDLNSWLHNVPQLMTGKPRCTLKMNPADAKRIGSADGEAVLISTSIGTIEAPVEVTDEMMPGVVSLPHGWGHSRRGMALSVAKKHPGVCVNEIIDDALVDASSGTSVLYGVPVKVRPAGQGTDKAFLDKRPGRRSRSQRRDG